VTWQELLRHRQVRAEDLEWPWWIPLGTTAFAVLISLAAAVQRDLLSAPGPDALVAVAVGGIWTAQCVLWWRFKIKASPLFGALVIGGVAILMANPVESDFAPFLLLLLAGEMAATLSVPVSASVAAAAALMVLALDLAGEATGAPLWIAAVIGGWEIGFAMQWQMRMIYQERRAQATLAEKAATEERQRIAREVHDVIAHSLSVTMLHLTGARHVLQSDGDIDEAVAALHDAEALGREAMADIRRTVGLLEQGSGGTAPMPAVGDVEELVAEFSNAGLDVRYHPIGDLSTLSPSAGLSLFRIVQESLANVAKHAPDATTAVTLDVADGSLRLVVRSEPLDGPRPPISVGNGGSGLKGMADRAALLGGTFAAGPDAQGGWKVEVTVPRDDAQSCRRTMLSRLLGRSAE